MAHSSGDVHVPLPPSDPLSIIMSSSTETANNANSSSCLHRAASYNHLPELQTEPGSPGVKRTFSDVNLALRAQSSAENSVDTGKDVRQQPSVHSDGQSKVAVSHFTLSTEELNDAAGIQIEDASVKPQDAKDPEPVARPSKPRSMSGKIATLARRPWRSTSTSRSPSPPGKDSRQKTARSKEQSPTRTNAPPSDPPPQSEPVSEPPPAEPVRRRTVLTKRPRRLSMFVPKNKNEDASIPSSPSVQSLRSKASLEKFPPSVAVSAQVPPPVPKTAAVALPHHVEHSRKKDELWGVFRGLEADFQKFQSKSSTLKINVLRSSLLPFLSRYSSHPSYKALRPEDLDRRVNILNKWWTGLLEMLNGKNHQSISGTDRPVYLEAVVGIMTRPEWRIPFPSSQSDTNYPTQLGSASTSKSDSSQESSSGSDFLVESIYHNARNIFVQNLLSQMAFVVERMSMRHAPASLVAFCGKACAYAFFFCPGVADILVRLWNTPADILRRILTESAVYKGTDTRLIAQELALNFPMPVRSLAFSSHAALVRYLRQRPNIPLSASQIAWQGPWLSRWCGRDTDLFFVFVKYFHVLFSEFLPANTEKAKRILAPGLLSVHGQLLVVLEDTLYRQSIPHVPDNPHAVSSVTFDDFIDSADTSVSALSLGVGAANCHRSMAENRLIILLRDLLSEASVEPSSARQLYAESFCGIMKAAARRTSLFDHNACFVLCDFIEESVSIIARYSHTIRTELFDWKFWLEVCRKMTQSHNSLTEVRVFSLFFCVWNTVTSVEERKKDLCLGLLLQEDFFYHYFSHWSPMVRAYFHRLVCWRLARYNGDPTPVDTTIYETLSDRLGQIWAYYLTFQLRAEKELRPPLSSAPCNPAPGRRIIIIRSDNTPSPRNLFMSFDRVVPATSLSGQATAYKNHGTLKIDPEGLPPDPQPPQRSKWSIFKSLFGGSGNSKPGEVTPPSSNSPEPDANATNGGHTGTNSSPNPQSDDHDRGGNGASTARSPSPHHQPFCFKFSLEWLDRPQWPSKNKRLVTPCLPVATQLYLQSRRSFAMNSSSSDSDSAPSSASGSETDLEERSKGDDKNDCQVTAGEQNIPNLNGKSSAKTSGRQHPNLPRNERLVASKYAGRALAEWAHVVSECDCFFERRRDEGVPSNRLVETPILGVESFRK